MPKETIKQILMRRDEMSADDADQLINDAKDDLFDMINGGDLSGAEMICEDWFGLEPDYLEELM